MGGVGDWVGISHMIDIGCYMASAVVFMVASLDLKLLDQDNA